MGVSDLPLSLLFLIHMQILQYPNIDDQFDIDIFDAQKRSLRARIKMMEDLGYWLAQRIEGKNIKKVIPTYPCIKPAETTAFRTSFAKYLEILRHNSIKENTVPSAWWRDTQVRKSLLEECSGDKFLRLLVALSTHVLYESLPQTQIDSRPEILYASQLFAAYSSQREWVEAGIKLLEWEKALMNIKTQLSIASPLQSQSKYASLSTPRLIALRASKLQDLMSQDPWSSELGKRALDFLVGFKPFGHERIEAGNVQEISPEWNRYRLPDPHSQPQVLPIAAAHYPSHLRRLGRPVFWLAEAKLAELASGENPTKRESKTSAVGLPDSHHHAHAMTALRGFREAEERAHGALESALRRVGRELTIKLEKVKRKKSAMKVTKSGQLWPRTQSFVAKGVGMNAISFWHDKESANSFRWDLHVTGHVSVGDEFLSISVTPDDIRRVRERILHSTNVPATCV